MQNSLKIVMYHYVRPIEHSQFPRLKGLEVDGFIRQLDFFEQDHTFVTVDQILASVKKGTSLPENSVWLTFDDGYKDHHDHVMPELLKRGIEGAFFPPAGAVLDHELLDVNAIHHILATADDIDLLKNDLDDLCLRHGIAQDQLSDLQQEYAQPNRFDDATTIYIKRLLQHALPSQIRYEITSTLFERYVGLKPQDFSKDLYMNETEVRTMINNGMYVGSHGNKHDWLNRLSYEEQQKDLTRSLEFLDAVGAPTKDWVICYPYGGYNHDTLDIAKNLGASLGVTTLPEMADLHVHGNLELPRFDTNDFAQ